MKTNDMILDEDKARAAAAHKARSAYRDDSFPKRACDRCGKNYRGPAVYCSLECATADA
jgi:hypothetical protein